VYSVLIRGLSPRLASQLRAIYTLRQSQPRPTRPWRCPFIAPPALRACSLRGSHSRVSARRHSTQATRPRSYRRIRVAGGRLVRLFCVSWLLFSYGYCRKYGLGGGRRNSTGRRSGWTTRRVDRQAVRSTVGCDGLGCFAIAGAVLRSPACPADSSRHYSRPDDWRRPESRAVGGREHRFAQLGSSKLGTARGRTA
jgi:hypothetical protein